MKHTTSISTLISAAGAAAAAPRQVRALLTLLTAAVLAACATPEPVDPSRLPAAPLAWKGGDGRWTVAAPAEPNARGDWWTVFDDPQLDALVQRAAEASTPLQQAGARLRAARALLRLREADRAPQIGARAAVSRATEAQAGGPPAPVLSALGVGLDLAYEVDLFGRLSAASRAAALDAQAQAALLRSTQLLVQAEVAQAYLALRALDAERALVRRTLEAYQETQALTARRFAAGDVAELDLARVLAQVASTESDALALDRQRAQLEHALALLVGASASDFSLAADAAWTPALPVIPAGVPATLLTRRPDISAAQRTLMAAQERVGIARAAWFPNLALTASGGVASTELADLFQASARSWGIGALLSLPLFDGGRREAGVEQAAAGLDLALAGYRDQVLGAVRDVEDQLVALHGLALQAEAQGRAVAAASRATVLSDARYRDGFVSQLELLDAQRGELTSRRQALQLQAAQAQATVGLVRALGGGWAAEVSPGG